MLGIRAVIALTVLCSVAAEDQSAGLVDTIFSKASALWKLGRSILSGKLHGHHHGHHGGWHHHGGHGGWHRHHKFQKMMREAHECHRKCGADVECHSKCPKPWATLSKACKDFPAIKACRDTCKDADCIKCPKFDEDWMNKRLQKDPERIAKVAEEKCPLIEKIAACHHACAPGDHQCHRKCPKMFPGQWRHHGHHDHDGHHGHHDHDGPAWPKIKKMMKRAHMCHWKCGSDVACHSKCPKPMAKFAKVCQEFPAIKECMSKCKNDECEKCPKFDLKWLNKKFAQNPKRIAKVAELKCPLIEKAHACHKACAAGDFQCHHKCPTVFPGHRGPHGRHGGPREDIIV